MANEEQTGRDALYIPDDLAECQEALTQARRELLELNDKFLRAAAQLENIRKWTERDVMARSKEERLALFRQFLEVMDNLDRALSQPAELDVLYQGVRLTRAQFGNVFARAGLEKIKVEAGDAFDPTYHDGIEVRFGDVDQPAVLEVVQTGYLYENNLVRPAGVIVIRPAV